MTIQDDLLSPWMAERASLSLFLSQVLPLLGQLSAPQVHAGELPDEALARLAAGQPLARRTATAEAGAPASLAQRLGDGRAVLSVSGTLFRRRNSLTDIYGLATYEQLAQDVLEMADDDEVQGLLVRIDSPGGMAQGIEDVVDAMEILKAAGKPIHAHIDGLGASAAYFIASAADRITASASAIVGSIGTVLNMYDYSGLFEKFGVKAMPIRSGPHKARPSMGEEITEDAQAPWQAIVDDFAQLFFDQVSRGRGLTGKALRAVTDGRAWLAGEAQTLGLIDGIERADEALANLATTRSTTGSDSAATSQEDPGMPGSQTKGAAGGGATTPPPVGASAEERLDALKAAFPNDPQFVLDQLPATAGLTAAGAVLHAKAAATDGVREQLKAATTERDALKAEVAGLKSEIEQLKAGNAGVDPVNTQGGSGADPIKAYDDLKAELRAKGDTSPSATIARNHPAVNQAYLAAVNAGARKPVEG